MFTGLSYLLGATHRPPTTAHPWGFLFMSVFALRRERLWQTAVREGLDVLLITSPINVTYLTGFSGDSSFLLLAKGRGLLVSDGRFSVQI